MNDWERAQFELDEAGWLLQQMRRAIGERQRPDKVKRLALDACASLGQVSRSYLRWHQADEEHRTGTVTA